MSKTNYKKPSRLKYLLQIIGYLFNPLVIIEQCHRMGFVVINQSLPQRKFKKKSSVNIHPSAVLRHADRIVIGNHCLINHNNVLQAGKTVAWIRIGDHVHTGPGVMMFAYNHMFESGTPSILQGYEEHDIIIGNDVWIGANSVILAGSVIEDGVVIGASSLVRGRLEENTVYAGNPLKKIGARP